MTRHNYRLSLLVAGIALLVLSAVGGTLASNGFSIPWLTVDGGGGVSTGDGYSIGATAGQPDAGQMTGAGYTLNSGFWPGGASGAAELQLHLPIITAPSAGTSSSGFR